MAEINPTGSPSPAEPSLAFQPDGDTPDSQIWKASEKAILQSHIQGYRGAPSKQKSSYIIREVIPEIKKDWNNRYMRKKLKKDPALQKEWDKKKKVNTWK